MADDEIVQCPTKGAAMPNGRCKLHGGKSTGPRTPDGLERCRRANWEHGHFSHVLFLKASVESGAFLLPGMRSANARSAEQGLQLGRSRRNIITSTAARAKPP